jgi:hypothetical protein
MKPAEAITVIAAMIAGYWLSGMLARRRTAAVPTADTADLIEA